ncbi:hypothetical protein NDU88_007141 [Pleurodeles waltl]|uniref:Uncharacterized protein n=1 Tax=Pleurodeles waltl TaxID=8319 RepID=A0AAV7N9D1_PLEWA|nr:hypothetical protein NDU88_007141 [Pleurodeles waltl]
MPLPEGGRVRSTLMVGARPPLFQQHRGAPLPFPVAPSCSGLDPTLSTVLRRPARTLCYFSSAGAPLLSPRGVFLLGSGPGPLHRSPPPCAIRSPARAARRTRLQRRLQAQPIRVSRAPNPQGAAPVLPLPCRTVSPPGVGQAHSGFRPPGSGPLVSTLGSGSSAGYRSCDVSLPVPFRWQGWFPTRLSWAQPPRHRLTEPMVQGC